MPDLHPSLYIPPSSTSSTTAVKLGNSHLPLSRSGMASSTVSPTFASPNLFLGKSIIVTLGIKYSIAYLDNSSILSACFLVFLLASSLSLSIWSWLKHSLHRLSILQGMELQMRALHLKQLDALAGSVNPNLQLKQLVEGTTSTAISSKERSSRSPRLISDPDRDGKVTKDTAGEDGGASSPTDGTLESTSKIKKLKLFLITIGHMLRQFHKNIDIFE